MGHALRILVVEDDAPTSRFLARDLARRGHSARTASSCADALAAMSGDIQLLLLDLGLPDGDGLAFLARLKEEGRAPSNVVVMTAENDARRAVEAMKMGAHDYVLKPFDADAIGLVVERVAELVSLRDEVAALRRAESARLGGLIGSSPPMQVVLEQIQLVARTPATTVLISGETGTGKELVARAIHQASERSRGPFVAVNCSAIQENLLESELFGYEPGAFTDAKGTKQGLLEVADGGTVLLDEIGDMDGKLQAKILRVLEERVLRRLGGTRDVKVDLRVIAATNRDLVHEIEAGRFRRDLYYRLNVVPIHLAPLRDRVEDIPLLAATFLARLAHELGRPEGELTPEALRSLQGYPWPGNVRELRNVIERVLIFNPGHVIAVERLPVEIRTGLPESDTASQSSYADARREVLRRFEDRFFRTLLEATGGNVSEAARRAGLDRGSLQRLLRRGNIAPGRFRG